MNDVKVLVVAVMLLPLSLASVKAGRLNDEVRVKIPFKVKVGDVTLQPGEYVINQFDSPSTRNLLIIQSKNGRLKVEGSVFTIGKKAAKVPEQAKVVFRRVGDWHFFDTVWVPGKENGYYFPPSDFEKQVTRELALKKRLRGTEMVASEPLYPRTVEANAVKQAGQRTEPASPAQRTEAPPAKPPAKEASSLLGVAQDVVDVFRKTMPKGGTSLPLLGVFGLFILMLGIGMRKFL